MPRTIMEPDSKVKFARDGMPVVRHHIYLDTGSVGPVSAVYAQTLARCTDEDLRLGRALKPRFERIDAAKTKLRAGIASLLDADAEEVELTQGTTDSIRTLLGRYDWRPGDEIVSTRLEFPACMSAIAELASAGRISLRIADVPEQGASELGWLEQCVTARTRLIALSGVAYTTGQRLPLEEIARFAVDRGIHTLVDGAQLVGAGALDLSRTPIDFVAMPLQKWLCGPEGIGALYARKGTVGLRLPGRCVHGWPVLEAAAEHLEWLRERLGWEWIRGRTHRLSRYAREALEPVEAVRLVTPDAHAGLVSIRTHSERYRAITDRLRDEKLVVRLRPELDVLRISTAFFTNEDEIDRFVAAIS